MKILDENNNIIENPDLNLGYLKDEKIFVQHHNAIDFVPAESHYETLVEYPNGGKDLIEIIDIPATEAVPAWDEYEEVQRYITYTPEELAEINKMKNTPTLLDKIEAQTMYTAMETDTLIIAQSPATIPSEETNNERQLFKDSITKWYKQGIWNDTMIDQAVEKGVLTLEEANTIKNY